MRYQNNRISLKRGSCEWSRTSPHPLARRNRSADECTAIEQRENEKAEQEHRALTPLAAVRLTEKRKNVTTMIDSEQKV